MNNRRFGLWVAILFSVALLTGVLVQSRARFSSALGDKVDFARLLPRDYRGWSCAELPVAETPEMKNAVSEILNYNEALFRIYRREGIALSLFVAYWEPGRNHPRMVALHTPDYCWVDAGWTMDHAGATERLPLAGNRTTRRGQRRIFTISGTVQHVLYWHLYGGQLAGYAEGSRSGTFRLKASLVGDLISPPREQYFIRLAANVPFDKLTGSGLLEEILGVLAPTGLCADGTP